MKALIIGTKEQLHKDGKEENWTSVRHTFCLSIQMLHEHYTDHH